MIPYFLLFIIAFCFCYIAKEKRSKEIAVGVGEFIANNNLAIPVFFFFLWILLSCRNVKIGNDTLNYKNMFIGYMNQPLSEIFRDFSEVLFRFLNWLIGLISDSFQVFLTIVSLICVVPLAVFYSHKKRHSYLKIILFMNMPVFVMLFSGIRQAIAMSIGLIAFYFVKKKKPLPFLLTVILALGFHESAFMLFAMYPLFFFKLKKRHIYIIVPIVVVVYIFNVPIFNTLVGIMQLFTSRYEDVSYSYNGAITMMILFFGFLLFSYIIPDDKKITDEFVGMRNYLLLVALLQCFAPLHTLAMRMNYYYILFVPEVVTCTLDFANVKFKNIARLAEIVMCLFFTGYFVLNIIEGLRTGGTLNTIPYVPFWAE